ncbi:sulfotransferase [Candidatus Poribacteria bacterium]|nr:sulfotransferase [Candidatus Poribacteria bacterium]
MIFVVGNSRSGTTMMGRILGNHPEVFTFGELHFFGQLWSPAEFSKIDLKDSVNLAATLFCIQTEGYRTHGKTDRFLQEAKVLCENIKNYPVNPPELFKEFLIHETHRNNKSIPCDQTPRNVFYIDEILKQYTNAKIINMIRDPRDVLFSQKKKWKRRFLGGSDLPLKESLRDWINYHPITISRIWHTAINTADQYTDHNRVFTVYFEKLLTNPEKTVREICNFAELSYCSTLLNVPQVGSSEDSDKPENFGINPDRVGNWNDPIFSSSKLSSAEIYINQKINSKLMEKHNYSPVIIKPNLLNLIVFFITFPVKTIGAILSNFDRIKNIRETLKRRL